MTRNLKLLTFAETSSRTKKGRTAIYDEIAKGTFPRPVKTGRRSVAWVEAEIDTWIERLVESRDSQASTAIDASVISCIAQRDSGTREGAV